MKHTYSLSLSIFFLCCCQLEPSIGMRTQRLIYEFFDSIDDFDAHHIICMQTPTKRDSSTELTDPISQLPIGMVSFAPYLATVYLDEKEARELGKADTLSPEIKYILIYRATFLKIAWGKYHGLITAIYKAAIVGGPLLAIGSSLCLGAILNDPKLIIKACKPFKEMNAEEKPIIITGALCAGLMILSYLIYKVQEAIKINISSRKNLLNISRKAREITQQIIGKMEPVGAKGA